MEGGRSYQVASIGSVTASIKGIPSVSTDDEIFWIRTEVPHQGLFRFRSAKVQIWGGATSSSQLSATHD